MKRLTEIEQVDRLFEGGEAVVFKHSTMCPISSAAHRQIEEYVERNPQALVHKVLVIEDRPVSNYIAEKTGIRHASPQVIRLSDGKVTWHDSHFRITAKAVEKAGGAPVRSEG